MIVLFREACPRHVALKWMECDFEDLDLVVSIEESCDGIVPSRFIKSFQPFLRS